MADTADAPVAPSAQSPVKGKKGPKKASGPKKPASKPTHPPTGDMVRKAIKELKERGGSSLQAIKKYIAATYKVDAEKLAPFIRKYLRTAVASGALVQTKGKGAAGSFKLSATATKEKPKAAKKPAAKKPKAPAAKKPKAAAAKKPKTPKKAAKPKKPKASTPKPKKAKAAAKPKTPKVKKAAAKKVSKPKAARK